MPDEPQTGTATVHRVEIDATRRRIRTPGHERDARRLVAAALFALDVAACLAPMLARAGSWRRVDDIASAVPIAALAACCWLALYVVGAYRLRELIRGLRGSLLAAAGCLGALGGLVAYKLLLPQSSGPEPVVRFTLVAIAGVVVFGLWAVLSRKLCTVLLQRREAAAKLLFVGPPEQARSLAEGLAKAGPAPPMTVFSDGTGADCAPAALDEHLAGSVRAIVLAVPVESLPQPVLEALIHARLADIPVVGPSQIIEQICERTPVMLGDHAWMLQEDSINPGRSPLYLGSKRLIDLVAAIVGIALTLPLMLATALAVKLTSPGPVFFTQVREGRWKKPFRIVKFRTMRTDAEKAGAQWATKNDPRVTPIGAFLRKSRLDELPQFWNVLVGDMSLVGPRPERPEFNQMLVERIPWYDLRHLAKPGLTGWAQVCYPYGASVEDAIAKLEYEVYWLKNATLRFDLRIILRTIAVVVGLRGR